RRAARRHCTARACERRRGQRGAADPGRRADRSRERAPEEHSGGWVVSHASSRWANCPRYGDATDGSADCSGTFSHSQRSSSTAVLSSAIDVARSRDHSSRITCWTSSNEASISCLCPNTWWVQTWFHFL